MDEEKYNHKINYSKEDLSRGGNKGKSKSTAKEKDPIWKKVVLSVVLVMLFCIGAVVGYLGYSLHNAPTINEKPIQNTQGDETVKRQDGVYTFLVCGKDKVALNTDTILVFSLDTENHTIQAMSIPRDTMSNVSRYVKKINAAYASGDGDIEVLKDEITMLLGINIDRYVIVNMSAFEELIDAIGGVTIDVKQDMHYNDPYQNLSIHISKGVQTLNGEDSVKFLRYRSGYINGDLGRIEAQQQFIGALMEELKSPSIISKIPALADVVVKNMDTDLTTQDIIWFAQEALNVDLATGMQIHTLPGESMWVLTGKQWLSYYIPDEAGILTMVNQFFNPYDTEITASMLDLIDKDSMEMSVNRPSSSSNDTDEDDEDEKDNNEDKDTNDKTNESDNSSGKDHNEESTDKTSDKDTQNPSESDSSQSGTDDDEDKQSTESNNDENNSQELPSEDENQSSSERETQVVTDSKGNIYEIDVQTGEIVQVIYEVEEEETTEENTSQQ